MFGLIRAGLDDAPYQTTASMHLAAARIAAYHRTNASTSPPAESQAAVRRPSEALKFLPLVTSTAKRR
jgi:hypothetical protein